jgi:hypothetical protein
MPDQPRPRGELRHEVQVAVGGHLNDRLARCPSRSIEQGDLGRPRRPKWPVLGGVDTEMPKTEVTRVFLPALFGGTFIFSMELQEVDALPNPPRRNVHSMALPFVTRLEMRQVLAV